MDGGLFSISFLRRQESKNDLDKYSATYFFTTFMTNILINNTNGDPCKSTSNQSIGFIPVAPPNIHFNLPRIWGSGKKGASPRVRHKIKISFQLFKISIDLFSNSLYESLNFINTIFCQKFNKGRANNCALCLFSCLLKGF